MFSNIHNAFWGILFVSISFSTTIAQSVQSTQTYSPLFQQLDSKKSKAASVNFEGWLKNQKVLSSELTLSPISSEKDELGFTHQRYQITKAEIPIEGAVLISHSNQQNQIHSFNGSLFRAKGISTEPNISKKEALQSAIKHVGAELYRWEIEAENEHRRDIHQDKNASYFPIPELVIAPKDLNFKESNFRLAYKIDVYALQPLQRLWVYVDAQTGEIIATENQLCTAHASCSTLPTSSASSIGKVVNCCQSLSGENLCAYMPPCSFPLQDTPATAVTKYSGTQTITTDQQNNTYLLQEEGRNIATYNMHQAHLFSEATVFEDADNYWDNFNADQDEIATDVHWATKKPTTTISKHMDEKASMTKESK